MQPRRGDVVFTGTDFVRVLRVHRAFCDVDYLDDDGVYDDFPVDTKNLQRAIVTFVGPVALPRKAP